MATTPFQFGMIGLGVMGSNLLLNMSDHGFRVIGYDINAEKIKQLQSSARANTVVKGTTSLDEFITNLEKPRRIMLLVPAGNPVDEVIKKLVPLLEHGDILIDGGNSFYRDTQRRISELADKGIHFIGTGVSGGEEGARLGPSMMVGGSEAGWQSIRPFLESVAAKVNNEPCIDRLGTGAAGHYVKMVHNGIEYAIMQLIGETYHLLHEGCGMSNDALHTVFKEWNEGELRSFLIEITAAIFLQKDTKTKSRLLDVILDKAGSKGTGKWTSQDAMDLGVPIPAVDAAVAARSISALKAERELAAELYHVNPEKFGEDAKNFVGIAGEALYAAMLLSYLQGMSLLFHASKAYNMEIPLLKVIKVWRGGCIIRSSLLEIFISALKKEKELPNLLLNEKITGILIAREQNLRKLIMAAAKHGFPVPCFSACLAYFDSYRAARLPANLLQAQRDYFGAHGYQRIGEEGTFHTEWNGGRGEGK